VSPHSAPAEGLRTKVAHLSGTSESESVSESAFVASLRLGEARALSDRVNKMLYGLTK